MGQCSKLEQLYVMIQEFQPVTGRVYSCLDVLEINFFFDMMKH